MSTLKRGDTVYLNYGSLNGDDYGTVVGSETDRWGTHYWVRLSDFSLTTVEAVDGCVLGKFEVDCLGEEFLSVRGVTKIGTYLVEMT